MSVSRGFYYHHLVEITASVLSGKSERNDRKSSIFRVLFQLFRVDTLGTGKKFFKKKKKKKTKKKKMMIIIFLMLIDGCLVAAPIRSEQSRPLVQLLEEETNDSEFLG